MKAVTLCALCVLATPAVASPDDLVSAPLVLDRGELEATLTAEVNLEPRFVGKPLSLAPELAIGVTPRLTIGLIHGDRSVDQIAAGGSICVRDCDAPYPDAVPAYAVGVDARYELLRGPLSIAPRLRLLVRDFDPFKPAVTLGGLIRRQGGRFAITSDPYLRLGLDNRDLGNRAALFLPLWLAVQPTCHWMIALHTGWNSDLVVARDGWHVPIALVVSTRPIHALEVMVEGGFASLIGPQNQTKDRALLVTVGWRRR